MGPAGVDSANGDEQVREHVMAYVREKARDLALQGLSAQEIVGRIDAHALNRVEREMLEKIARRDVELARAGAAPDGAQPERERTR
jgi:hypothetical protein